MKMIVDGKYLESEDNAISEYWDIEKEEGVRSLNLTIFRYVLGFDEIVSSIYDLISV